MAQLNSLVSDLQKNHQDLFNLAASFQDSVAASDRKIARKILGEIDNLTKMHFEFEKNYLYPRMLRLTRQIAEKLGTEREAITEFIAAAKDSLKQTRLRKDKISNLLRIPALLSQHLKDCDGLVFLADKFGADEKNKLHKKFKEYCAIKTGI